MLLRKRYLSKTLALCLLLAAFLSSVSYRPAAVLAEEESKQSRHLIICIDGIGFTTIQKMRERGRFKNFSEPARMISPFPTLTNVAMADILEPAGALTPAGYEDSYFDVEKNRMRGGLFARLNQSEFIKGTFRELFDYHPSAIKSALGYAAPPLSTYIEAVSDLIRLRQNFLGSKQQTFVAYTGATDSLAHLGGEWLTRLFLSHLESTIEDILRDSEDPVDVTIFSDHGNHFREYRRVALKKPLRKSGFRIQGRIKDSRSVVIPQFGLVGCAVLFTEEANKERLAKTLANIRGVDFVAYEDAGIVHVVSRSGRATIERAGQSYRYLAIVGDPLELSPVSDELRRRGKESPEGFIHDRDWFAATLENNRPDAVKRIYDGTVNGVKNRAQLIVSFEDGYYYGSSGLDIFAFLQATHGNAMKEQSHGFVMTTNGTLPEHIRAEDLWNALGNPRLSRSPVAQAAAERKN